MIEVAITGAGVVSPLGCDLETFGRRMFAGESGIRGLSGGRMPAGFPVPYGGLVERRELEWPEGLEAAAGTAADDRLFAACATARALARLPPDLPVDGIIYGTSQGLDFPAVRESFRGGLPDALGSPQDGGLPPGDLCPESAIEAIAELLEHRGHGALEPARQIAVSSACATGNQALGIACHRIRHGRWQRAVAGAVDSRLTMANLMSFHMLSALITEDCPPEKASRPFSIDRAGFVRSEGAASFVLESRQAAEARGAEILALITGYAHTSDAYHFTEGRPDGGAVVAAIEGAIRDAGLEPPSIDAISAHGTSTRLNDRVETAAIKQVFGERAYRVPVSALKSQLGHGTVAAGAVEAASCLLMLRHQRLAPTINYREDEIDPDCDLDYVANRSRPARLTRMLSNSFGFGGHNACLVFEAGDG